MKIIRDKEPKRLHDILKSTYYSERRNVARGLFFDSFKTKFGRQSLQNRLQHFLQIKEPWNELGTRKTNDWIHVLLKKTFFSCHAQHTFNLCNIWNFLLYSLAQNLSYFNYLCNSNRLLWSYDRFLIISFFLIKFPSDSNSWLII